MDYIYVLLLQFKFILFLFLSTCYLELLHIPIGAIISLKWMTLTFIQLLVIHLHFVYTHTNTECVDKVRYLPYGKSFTFSTFLISTFSVYLSNHDICQILFWLFPSENNYTTISFCIVNYYVLVLNFL